MGFWCWAPHLGVSSSPELSCRTARSADSERQFPMCQIRSVVGKSCCSVPTQEPTTFCALSPGRKHGIWNTARTLVGEISDTVDAVEDARTLVSLPLAERCAHPACRASWTDASHMIARGMLWYSPCQTISTQEKGVWLKMATDRLDRQGFGGYQLWPNQVWPAPTLPET